MKSSKPRGKTPSLIGGSLGRPRKCVIQRECACKRCGEAIQKDMECYEISQLGGSFSAYKRYCDDCFHSILDKTKADLDALFIDIED